MKILHLKILVPLICLSACGFNTALRNKIILRQNNMCGNCKMQFSKLVPHEIHHLNHNKSDNNPTNLIALCANCHSAHHRFRVPIGPMYPYHEYDSDNKIYYENFNKFKNSLDW